jgi:hypothetical protein
MKKTLLIMCMALALHSCKKSDDNATVKTTAQLLIDGGQWYTQKSLLTKTDGTTVTKDETVRYLPNDSYVYSAHFFENGIYFQDQQILGLSWSLSGNTLTMANLTGSTTTGQIVSIDANTFTLERTGASVYSNVSYTKVDQVFIH